MVINSLIHVFAYGILISQAPLVGIYSYVGLYTHNTQTPRTP